MWISQLKFSEVIPFQRGNHFRCQNAGYGYQCEWLTCNGRKRHVKARLLERWALEQRSEDDGSRPWGRKEDTEPGTKALHEAGRWKPQTGILKGVDLKGAMFIVGLRKYGLGSELGNSNLIRAACLGATRGQENECHPEVTMLTKRWSWGKSSFQFKPVGGWFPGRTWGYRGVSLLLCPQVLEEKAVRGGRSPG